MISLLQAIPENNWNKTILTNKTTETSPFWPIKQLKQVHFDHKNNWNKPTVKQIYFEQYFFQQKAWTFKFLSWSNFDFRIILITQEFLKNVCWKKIIFWSYSEDIFWCSCLDLQQSCEKLKHPKQMDISQGSYSSVSCIEAPVSISVYHTLFHEKASIKSTY